METTLKVKVIDVDVIFVNNGSFAYRFTFDSDIEGIIKDIDGSFKVGMTNHLDFNPTIVAEAIAKNRTFKSKLNTIKAYCIKTGLDLNQELVEHISNFMFDRTIVIDRSTYKAGDEYTDYNGNICRYQFDGYRKDIIAIE